MATNVVMPQMGESIAEGTIVRWIKKVGDAVERDEPLFEISTDKVDAEIPAPAAGVLAEIRHKDGETVSVNTVVAVIEPAGAAVKTESAAPAEVASPKAEPSVAPKVDAPAVPTPAPSPQADGVAPQPTAPPQAAPTAQSAPAAVTTEERLRHRSSPLVRRIAKEHGVDISQIAGTGIGGRVTRDDILSFIDSKGTGASPAAPAAAQAPAAVEGRSAARPAGGDRVEKMSVMRKKIAEHMVLSRRTSAHVHSVFEVNFSRVAEIRERRKGEYERAGVKLTFLSFILKGVAEALRAVPVVNASVDGDQIIYHQEVNLGVAVALDRGLIVPVIKHADEKNLLGLSRAVNDLASRARSKQLKPEEVTGGTFTITNPGVFGALFGMPIINQPQVAILGVGNIEKRPVVIDDAIAIRRMGYLTLGYDHRLIDGAVADEFMSRLKALLENWDPAAD